MRSKRTDRLTVEPKPLWQRVLAGERLPKRQSRHPKCEGTIEDHRTIALDVRELIRKRVFEQPAGSIFHLNIAFPWLRLMRLNSASLDGTRHRPHHQRATGFGKLRRHGPANEVGVPAVCSAHLHALPSRTEAGVPSVQRPLVCGTAHQQLWPEGAGQTEDPAQTWRLRPTLGGQVSTKAARHVATDLCAALCGAGPDRAQACPVGTRTVESSRPKHYRILRRLPVSHLKAFHKPFARPLCHSAVPACAQ